MPSQINNYQCPACTGPLHYVGTSDKLECDYCGSSYSIAEIEKLYAEQEAKAKEEYAQAQASGEGWSDSGNDSWGTDAEGMKVYSCPSCGAELIADATTAASCCPYCGNNNVVPGQFEDGRRPDRIIPFKITKEQAIEGLKNHYKGKKLLPRSFASTNSIQEITGVYVPFWLFDGSASADVEYEATKTRSERHGDDEIIYTEHYEVSRSGRAEFTEVPVDASSKMPSGHMDSIEPYDYSDLRDFSTAYLPGFLADKYDVAIEASAPRADVRFENTILSDLAETVTGYDSVNVRDKNVRIKRGTVKYALFPVWMLSTQWNGQTYTFAMNGQTGKMVGDLPIDKGRLVAYFFKWFIPAAVIVTLIQMLM